MIDLDVTDLKLFPNEHINLMDYEYAVGLENKNKTLEKAILGLISAGLIVLIYYIIKDESNKEK